MKRPLFFCSYAVTTLIFANNKFLSATNDCKGPHEVTERELKLKHTLHVYYAVQKL